MSYAYGALYKMNIISKLARSNFDLIKHWVPDVIH